MDQLFCRVSVANVMKEPDHRAELHTQLLFGDRLHITDRAGHAWIKISTVDATTHGWILLAQCVEPDHAAPTEWESVNTANQARYTRDGQQIPLLSGTYLPADLQHYSIAPGDILKLKGIPWQDSFNRQLLNSFLHAPYMWGGMSIFGIDCSGLSKLFYRFHQLPLPHLAAAQMQLGQVLDFLPNACCGDLAFFENENGEINHVGIMLSNCEIIHASESNGCVMIDAIDQQGIINRFSGKRTHTLRLIKRLREIA